MRKFKLCRRRDTGSYEIANYDNFSIYKTGAEGYKERTLSENDKLHLN